MKSCSGTRGSTRRASCQSPGVAGQNFFPPHLRLFRFFLKLTLPPIVFLCKKAFKINLTLCLKSCCIHMLCANDFSLSFYCIGPIGRFKTKCFQFFFFLDEFMFDVCQMLCLMIFLLFYFDQAAFFVTTHKQVFLIHIT